MKLIKALINLVKKSREALIDSIIRPIVAIASSNILVIEVNFTK